MAKDQKAGADGAGADAKAPTSQAGRAGFVMGLIGAPVRKVETDAAGKETRRIVDYRFIAKDGDKVVANFANVEAPYPTTDDAAREMAADCETSFVRLVDGKYETVKLTGLAAAVAIARDGRPVETLRGRARNGKANEAAIRSAAAALYGFSAGDAPKPEVAAADVAAIMGGEGTPEEKLAAMMALLAQQGIKSK